MKLEGDLHPARRGLGSIGFEEARIRGTERDGKGLK